MSRGNFYTSEEDNALLALYEDSSDTEKHKKKYLDIVKRGQRYGICKERNADAVAQHLSRLLNPDKDNDADTENDDLDTIFWRNSSNYFEKRFIESQEEWLEATLGSATSINEFGYIQWDFKAITRYVRNKYPEKYAERAEMLTNEQEDKK